MDRDGARIVRILTGRGLLLGVELVTVRDSKTPTTDAAEEIFSRALEVASASKPPWATSWIEHLSGIDAVYGSQHRHRDLPNWGVVNWAENVSYCARNGSSNRLRATSAYSPTTDVAGVGRGSP